MSITLKVLQDDYAEEMLDNCKKLLVELFKKWDTLEKCEKYAAIDEIGSDILFCEFLTEVTEEFVKELFREAGWDNMEHEAIADVIRFLKYLGTIR